MLSAPTFALSLEMEQCSLSCKRSLDSQIQDICTIQYRMLSAPTFALSLAIIEQCSLSCKRSLSLWWNNDNATMTITIHSTWRHATLVANNAVIILLPHHPH
jgi:hypothetical protein